MLPKSYIEFPLVILVIVVAIIFGLNLNLPSCNKAKKTEVSSPTGNNNPQNPEIAEGKSLFKSNCAACHNPKADGTGPALQGAVARWKAAGTYQNKTGEQWLKLWVKNWNEPVGAGYKYAVDMANTRPAQMNTFSQLTDEQIDRIFFYIDSGIPSTPVVLSN